MAIKLDEVYAGRVDTTDPNYTYGKPRNKQGDIDGTGTPYEELYFQDISGAFQALLVEGDITPSGNPDNATNSDIRDAILRMIRKPLVLKIFQSPTDGGLTEINTRTLNSGEIYEVRKVSDDSLATIYSDAAGTAEIVQNGTSNISDSTGVVEFFVADGDYYIEAGVELKWFAVKSARNFDSVEDMVSNVNAKSLSSKVVGTGGYYEVGDGGAALYKITLGNTGDDLSSHNIGAYTAVLLAKSNTVNILQCGAKLDTGYDNVNHIKSAVSFGVGVVPAGKFYSSPLRFGSDYDAKSLIGLGYQSTLSMISPDISEGSPLVHIPRVGGAYGGSEVGAKNFRLDKIRLYGGDVTSLNTFSTTGLVLEDSEGFSFGTIWCHGFYKSGLLFDGTCKNMTGVNYYGFDNGNQVGANTGGQGLAFSIDNESFQSAYIHNVVCYDNGVDNFGQGLDAASGNFGIGNLNCYGNGSSAMKIVSAILVDIGCLKSSGNNRHVSQPFSAVYTNGDFGTLNIGTLYSEGSAASSVAHTRSGVINIGSMISIGGGGSGITMQPSTGKVSYLNIDTCKIDAPTITGVTMSGSGDGLLSFGDLAVSNSPNQGTVVASGEFECQSYSSKNNAGTPLFLSGGDNHYIGRFTSSSVVANTAIVVGAGVNNAAIISARSKGSHTATLSDSGVNTYKPNVI